MFKTPPNRLSCTTMEVINFFLNLQVQQALKKHELLVAIIKKDQAHNKRLVRSLKRICYIIENFHVELTRMHIFCSMKAAFYLMTILWSQMPCNLFAMWLRRSWEWNIVITLHCCFESANKF